MLQAQGTATVRVQLALRTMTWRPASPTAGARGCAAWMVSSMLCERRRRRIWWAACQSAIGTASRAIGHDMQRGPPRPEPSSDPAMGITSIPASTRRWFVSTFRS
jgi:hypothetical protein